jgi:tetratricopeptide (TPR) repeat protein
MTISREHANSVRAHKTSVHPNRRRPLSPLPLLALTVFPLTATAQQAIICKGPAALEQTIASHPSTGAYDALGSWFATQNRFSCAISAFESAIRLDPTSWQGHYDLGIALLSSGNPQRAVHELQTASGLKPGSAQILQPLGSALNELNRHDEAIEAFKTILKADPQSVKALDGLTKALIAEKRYTAAIAELKNAPPATQSGRSILKEWQYRRSAEDRLGNRQRASDQRSGAPEPWNRLHPAESIRRGGTGVPRDAPS